MKTDDDDYMTKIKKAKKSPQQSLTEAKGLLTHKALQEVENELDEMTKEEVKQFKLCGSSIRRLSEILADESLDLFTEKKKFIQKILIKDKLKYQIKHPELYPLNPRMPDSTVKVFKFKPTFIRAINLFGKQKKMVENLIGIGIKKDVALSYVYCRLKTIRKMTKAQQLALAEYIPKDEWGEGLKLDKAPPELSQKFQKRAKLAGQPLNRETISAFKLAGAATKRLKKRLRDGEDYYEAKKAVILESQGFVKLGLPDSPSEDDTFETPTRTKSPECRPRARTKSPDYFSTERSLEWRPEDCY